MKGLILAGGTGTRLIPLTYVTNKHLLPVGSKPMILHSIEKMINADIKDIMIVTGTEHMGDMISLLGSGSKWGCEITYRVQDKADGIASALKLAENFIGDENFVVILGDNIFEDSIDTLSKDFKALKDENKFTPACMLVLKEVDEPSRFGVPEFDSDSKIIKIYEKPKIPPSSFCVTGIYFYDKAVFEIIKNLKPSDRGEYEISDLNNFYVEKKLASYRCLSGWWSDAGTHKSYRQANRLCEG